MILTLWQDRQLDLDSRIGDLLSGVPEDKRPITVQQLLNHTSGLLDSLGEDDAPLTRSEDAGSGPSRSWPPGASPLPASRSSSAWPPPAPSPPTPGTTS
ncbi:beta-lactamase family protein [Nonomuraea sp. KC401]|uniref:serine hydrolase n=1 Tax=Nonomuraea sp. KC401 TaxID=1848324 RepID=UPI0010FDE284|nr:serine hydrolase [Nonomuraea sp. K271]TLF71710.1 beta-lactamase family protein [Nonomuraea sp. KC401]